MKLFREFAVASAALAFATAVLGSWVRINNAGLTCPDWPLCHGALVPALHGGVVLEWSHRLIAFVESFVIVGAIVTGFRARKSIAGVTPTLLALAIIFAAQVSLGGVTVFLSNSPFSVMLHWGMGMALLATLTVLAALSILAPAPRLRAAAARRVSDGAAPTLAIAAVFAFVTMCIGAFVSSSYAGLACLSFPTCDGTIFGTDWAQLAQMLHRLAAFAFAIAAAIATYAALHGGSRRVRGFAGIGMSLVILQIALGAANVMWHLPTVLREAHAANAGFTFLAFVIAALLAALEPYRATQPLAERTHAAAACIATNA